MFVDAGTDAAGDTAHPPAAALAIISALHIAWALFPANTWMACWCRFQDKSIEVRPVLPVGHSGETCRAEALCSIIN